MKNRPSVCPASRIRSFCVADQIIRPHSDRTSRRAGVNLFGGDILQLVSGMAVAVVVGVIACGGDVQTENVGHGSSGGAGSGGSGGSSGATGGGGGSFGGGGSTSGDGGSTGAGGSATGAGGSTGSASPPTCPNPQSGCVLCNDEWYCPGRVFPQCPQNVGPDTTCQLTGTDCVSCGADGMGQEWSCGGRGSWGGLFQVSCSQ